MTETRRPIKSRSNAAIRAAAEVLARHSVTPNQISTASMVFAAIGAIALLCSVVCIVFISTKLI